MNHSPVAGNSSIKDARLLALALPIGRRRKTLLSGLFALVCRHQQLLQRCEVAPERPAELMLLRSTFFIFKHRDGQM